MEKELHVIRKFNPNLLYYWIQQQWVLSKGTTFNDIYVAIDEDLSPYM